MKPYTTYLFDFDYTLADSSRGIVTCFRHVLDRHGFTAVTDDAIKRTIGKTLEESFALLSGVTDPDRLAGFRKEYVREADVHMTVNTRLFPETASVLTALKDSGAQIGIISTKFRYRIKELMDKHFPAHFLHLVVGGEDVKTAKPSPEGLLLALDKLHAAFADIVLREHEKCEQKVHAHESNDRFLHDVDFFVWNKEDDDGAEDRHQCNQRKNWKS